jgi:hypothetical protein
MNSEEVFLLRIRNRYAEYFLPVVLPDLHERYNAILIFVP